jgi:hypothetical protein
MTTRKTTKKTEPLPAPAMSDSAYIAIPLKEYKLLLAKAAGQVPDEDHEAMFFWLDKFKREAGRWLPERLFNGNSDTYKRIKDMTAEQVLAWTHSQLKP